MNNKRPGMNIGAAVLFVFFGLLFFLLIYRFVSIQITGEAEGKALAAKASEIYLKSRVLEAKRGTIYDQKGEVIAEDTSAFKLIAILDESVSSDPKNPKHVVDIEKTAQVLSEYIDLSVSEIREKLDNNELFQVEFGNAGRDISHQIKKEIEAEKLPGITFIKESKRFYPNGVFSSHLVGFVQEKEVDKGTTITEGVMGIENSFNELLKGEDGTLEYKSDVWGYILPNSEEHLTPPKDGKDLYLTIDKKIQTFLEEAMNQVVVDHKPKKILAVVADPKTGKILGMAQRPTFHPDSREGIDGNWTNQIVESSYEPGSTMKTFSLAAAVNEGVFNPNEKYESGKYYVEGVPSPIKDWNNGQGWGVIPYLEGVQRSSNVAFANLLEKIGEDRYRQYLDLFGFGNPTGIDIPNENPGQILYNYQIEKVTTIFGQGTTVTPLQLIQAETAIANGGKMMKPYVIDKVVDPKTGEIIEETKPTVVGEPITKDAAEKVREYLASTVTSEAGTGRIFAIDGYNVAGKSGTAQILDKENGGYMIGKENYLFSFLGMAPAEDPQLIVYVAVLQPELKATEIGSDPVSKIFNPVMLNSLKYLNIKPEEKIEINKHSMPSVKGLSVENAKTVIEKMGVQPILIGNGSKIVEQQVKPKEEILEREKVILLTDGEMTIPDMTGWSMRDVLKVANLTGLKLNVTGSGFVSSQNIAPNSPVQKNDPLVVTLSPPAANQENSTDNIEEDAPLN